MDGLFHGNSHLEMDDDWAYPYDLGNHHLLRDVSVPFVCLSKAQGWGFHNLQPRAEGVGGGGEDIRTSC